MGHTSYSVENRSIRASADGYFSKTVDQIFEQNQVQRIHESMDPIDIIIREARDSAAHPNTVPIILGLDLTGSMRDIPHHLIKDGLPKMVSGIIQRGIPDPALLFIGVGDHECDRAPLQVGQFESGDAELDLWLTRTYIESGGGGNAGESYLLAWYFAAYHTQTDAMEKRGQKGFLFTIGDEPTLHELPMNALRGLMRQAVGQGRYTADQLLKAAQERYNVYHINVHHGHRQGDYGWTELLAQNAISCNDYTQIPSIVAEIVAQNTPKVSNISGTAYPVNVDKEEEML